MTAAARDGTALNPALRDLLHRWLPGQRWYPAKGRGVSLARVGGFPLPEASGGVGLEVHLLTLDSGDQVDLVQVPLTYRSAPAPELSHALLGEVDEPGLGHRWVYDGPHDPAFVQAWLTLVSDEQEVASRHSRAEGVLAPGGLVDRSAASRVLAGEQSNTSIIVGEGPDALMVKVFRVLADGDNPDVQVTAALSTAGVTSVPTVAGWVVGFWPAADGTAARGHLAVITEFLAGSQDAWREALTAATDGRPFTDEAAGLGRATAVVHAALRAAFGDTPATEHVREALVAGLQQRVTWALRLAPALVPHTEALQAHAERLGALGADPGDPLPDLQRVHGDFHLGQVLHSPTRGWVLLDFEGEPLRPLAERTVPDVALRDVVGVLRSFDYAAGQVELGRDDLDEHGRDALRAWATQAQDAFVDGYSAAHGENPRRRRELFDALWLDKALYEVVYETNNRPSWVEVPLRAVRRVLVQHA